VYNYNITELSHAQVKGMV